ncbi:hypothetical protein CA13_63090 [Planctomycetes bacterium CA13]|uniref:Uncharacterized protein n=1 Tax=Novipirellula herctigrandis TaxID=2527986 RepID=A0A5C5ZCG1_9BACT|nr:hypothetical protein CA13_63090 [Planctomycetes bacterium CA13]
MGSETTVSEPQNQAQGEDIFEKVFDIPESAEFGESVRVLDMGGKGDRGQNLLN